MQQAVPEAKNMEFSPTSSWTRVMRDLMETPEGEWIGFNVTTRSTNPVGIRNSAAHASYRHLRPYGFTFEMKVIGNPEEEIVPILVRRRKFPIHGSGNGAEG